MRSTPRIIFVDGLPGSGKTTLAQKLAARPTRSGLKTRFIPEYSLQHPLHWFDYHDGAKYIPPDFDSVPLAAHMANSLAQWETFLDQMQGGSEVLVLDGYPVLNSAGVFLWGDASRQDCQAYMDQVRELLKPVRPVLIYLRSTDLEKALARKLEFLQVEEQLESLIVAMDSQPFLRHRGLSGKPGLLQLWQSVQWALEYFYRQEWEHGLALERDLLDETGLQIRAEAFIVPLA